MHRHPWPGNVRELGNCLTRAVVLATGDVVRANHLGLSPVPPESPAHLKSLEEMEKEHVTRVLTSTGGHKARAADILCVSRPRLNRLMDKHGLD